jgi:hydrogenase nickel incorporation protein HypB
MSAKTLTVKKSILDANAERAAINRELLAAHGAVMINIMSSPGSGKTTLLLQTIHRLRDRYSLAVIEGDVASSIDADRIAGQNIPAIQINTSGGCHLDAQMVKNALDALDLDHLDLVFVENIGNLICTANFDLGADKTVVLLSVPEGDDKPYKYPLIFTEADVVLVNKIDVLPYFDFDLDRFPEAITGLNPSAKVLPVCAKTGGGLDRWCSWIEETVAAARVAT